jgi:hypothetical protein
MTRWVCDGCPGCCEANVSGSLSPVGCLLFPKIEAKWFQDCSTEETEAAKFKMTYTYKELDKKVQDLITAGQGQMARIQALEKEVARSTDSYLQKQIDALDKKIDDLEGKYRAHSHIYGTHQWDQYTSQPRYMG